jgi:hypothetical protein
MQSISNLPIEKEDLVVVYEAETGLIVHEHYVVTAKGGAHPGAKEQESDALEQFRLSKSRLKREVKSELAVLRVDPAVRRSGARFRVDVTKRVLVEAKD